MAETQPTISLSPLRKAAILLIALGEEASAEMMQQLPDPEVKRLSEEIASLKDVRDEQMEAVLREFYTRNVDRSNGRHGGPDFTHRLLNRAFGQDGARRVLNVGGKPANGIARLEPLVRNDPTRFARSLNEEHPQTIALIMAHLPATLSAELLSTFESDLRKQVAVRMARLDQVSPDVLARVAEGIGAKLVDVESVSREPVRGIHTIADLCNRLDPEIGDELLAEVEASNAELAESVRRAMFAFEDIITLDETAMKELTSRVDRKVLILALKGTSDQIKEHFTKRMSSRARDMLIEDLEALGAVKIKDVEAAQQEIIGSVRDLRQEGVISRGSGGGDVYVS
jgi:flagellar motor switch protein FliG